VAVLSIAVDVLARELLLGDGLRVVLHFECVFKCSYIWFKLTEGKQSPIANRKNNQINYYGSFMGDSSVNRLN
jgi:hypothetical protein